MLHGELAFFMRELLEPECNGAHPLRGALWKLFDDSL